MEVRITRTGDEEVVIPRCLLGHNLEMTYDTDRAVLANRVANPHFAAPFDPRTNLAEKWVGWCNTNFQGIRFEHLPHGGRHGSQTVKHGGDKECVLRVVGFMEALAV